MKRKDTVYGIAQSYGLTVEELAEANPEMKEEGYVLKKGDTVFIPMPKTKPALEKAASLKTAGKIKAGVMLPLHNVDGDGRRMTEYYRGLLIACDSLKNEGLNIEIYAWNVNIDADIHSTLLDNNARNLDVIFGPLYTKQVKPLADFCRKNDIKLVIPFSTTADDVRSNVHVFQVYQSAERLNARAIGAFVSRFRDCQPVIISSGDTSMQKKEFVSALTKELHSEGITYKTTNLNAPDIDFMAAFSGDKPNVVVLDTAHSPELNLVFRRLNELLATAPNTIISMFGYVEWLMYESTYRTLYNKYDAYIPSTFYYYKGISRIAAFERNYNKRFGETMQEQYIPRFALTGYDHAQFFIRGLYEKGAAFSGTSGETTYKALQTPLRFEKLGDNQGMQNKTFQLVHYKRDGVIETISY